MIGVIEKKDFMSNYDNTIMLLLEININQGTMNSSENVSRYKPRSLKNERVYHYYLKKNQEPTSSKITKLF
jgi:hypothetical protein